MEKKRYQTGGLQALTALFAENPDRQMSTEELCIALHGSTKGKSSVYRHLSTLCREGAVRKFQSQERGCAVYQYVGKGCDCGNHFHVKCSRCGSLCHLECADSAEFAAHVLREHGFLIDCGGSILYGICAACERRETET